MNKINLTLDNKYIQSFPKIEKEIISILETELNINEIIIYRYNEDSILFYGKSNTLTLLRYPCDTNELIKSIWRDIQISKIIKKNKK